MQRFINLNNYEFDMTYDYKTLESFVRSFERADEIIKEKNPDCIIAPMFGAVPFIDILNIINDEFPNEKVEYIPASNRVYRLRETLRSAFKKLIEAYTPNGGSFLSIDEVVSGNSLQRVYKQFEAARLEYANDRTIRTYGQTTDFRLEFIKDFRDEIVKSIRYNSIGIVDPKMDRQKKKKSPVYEKLVEEGIAIPVLTRGIITMDNTDFFPAKYKISRTNEGNIVNLPVVENFEISKVYIDFLKQVAEVVGKDPNSITVANIGKISESYKWVPEELRRI